MRLHIGDLPDEPGLEPGEEGWRPVAGLSPRLGYLLAALVGLLTLMLLSLVLSATSVFVPPAGEMLPVTQAAAWVAVFSMLLLSVPVHELLHLVCHPERGRSSRSILIVWPRRLRLGAYYDGCMTRREWLRMRAMPLIVLSLIPVGLLILLGRSGLLTSFGVAPVSFPVETALLVLTLTNAIGSGGDVLAMILVLRQVPVAGQISFRGGRAYWRSAASAADIAPA